MCSCTLEWLCNRWHACFSEFSRWVEDVEGGRYWLFPQWLMLAGHNTLSLRSFPRSRGLRLLLGSWSCSDVGVPGRLVGALGLGGNPPHPSFLCGRNRLALDAAGGLENLLYFDANPSKVSLGIFGWFGGHFVQRPERHYQAGQTWLAREKSREAESDCAKSFSEVKT